MLIQLSNVTKHYGAQPILSNIMMQMNSQDRVGLVGVNGAGKSTLLRIISGELKPDEGQIFQAKDLQIGYLAQQGALQSDRSIYEVLLQVFSSVLEIERQLRQLEQDMAREDLEQNTTAYETILHNYSVKTEQFRQQGGYEIEAKVKGVLQGMGFGNFPLDTPVHTLSGGQKTRLALARLLLQEPDLLMLDEPTNYLDIATLNWLESYLRAYPKAILVVSHDRYFLDSLVTTIYEIERTKAKKYTGNYSRYMEQKAAEYEIEQRNYDQQQDEILKTEQFIQQNIARASTSKRAQSRRKSLEKIERLERPIGELKRASFQFEVERNTGLEVLQVSGISIAYPAQPPLFPPVDFQLQRGDRVALIGPNGIGKSSLFKVLTEQLPLQQGTIHWGTHVKIGYYDQEQTNLDPKNTILEEVWKEYPHLDEVRIRTVLGNFLFSGEDVLRHVSTLSGGEKARVALAKLMLQNANVLILDEPTNHLDLFSKEVLESALIDYEGTILFISHDRYFLNKLAERVLELSENGVRHFLGNYDDYLEKLQEMIELARENTESIAQFTNDTAVSTYEEERKAKREERSRLRKLEQCEKEISELETVIAQLEEKLIDPDYYQDYVKLQQLNEQITEHKQQLELQLTEWEKLMS